MPAADTASLSAPATPVASLAGHSAAVTALAFTPDRGLLASAGRDGTVRVWDIAGRKPGERGLARRSGDPFCSLAFSPSGRLLFAGSGGPDGLVVAYDVTDTAPREAGVLRGPAGPVHALAASPDGRWVAGGGDDRTVRVWEVTPSVRADARALLTGHTGPVVAAVFAPDSRGLATAGRDGARLWAISPLRSWGRASLEHGGEVESVAFTPDGQGLATAGRRLPVRVWDLTGVRPAVRTEFGGPAAGVGLVLVSPDGGLLVGVGPGPRVVNWEARTGRPAGAWEVGGAAVSCYALTKDGRYLARGSADGRVDLYRVAEKRV